MENKPEYFDVCERCIYWDNVYLALFKDKNGEDIYIGYCRINPPVLVGEFGKWPKVQNDDWCGLFSNNGD